VGYFFGKGLAEDDSIFSFAMASRWGRLALILVNAIFAGVSFIGVLAVATALVVA
jgi:hypothetical protein